MHAGVEEDYIALNREQANVMALTAQSGKDIDKLMIKHSAYMYKTIISRWAHVIWNKGVRQDFVAIDAFVQDRLPDEVSIRKPAHILDHEYNQVALWVSFREYEGHKKYPDPCKGVVQKITTEAFQLLKENNFWDAVKHLTKIDGCDRILASAILSVSDFNFPFLSTPLLNVVRKNCPTTMVRCPSSEFG